MSFATKINTLQKKASYITMVHYHGLHSVKLEGFLNAWREIMHEGGIAKKQRESIIDSIDLKYLKKLIISYKPADDNIKPVENVQNNDDDQKNNPENPETLKREEYKQYYKRKLLEIVDMNDLDSFKVYDFFLQKEDINSILHNYETDYLLKEQEKFSRPGKAWDPVIRRHRRCRTEHKWFRTLTGGIVILLGALSIYAFLSRGTRNKHWHNYLLEGMLDPSQIIKETQDNLHIHLMGNVDCTINFVDETGFRFLGMADAYTSDLINNPAVYSLRTSLSDDLKGQKVENTTMNIQHFTVRRRQGFVKQSEQFCILNIVLHNNKKGLKRKVQISTSAQAQVDVICNLVDTKLSKLLDLKIISSKSDTTTADVEPNVLGKLHRCEFNRLAINTTFIAFQIDETPIANIDIHARKGWVYIQRKSGRPLQLNTMRQTKKCFKFHGRIQELSNNSFVINDDKFSPKDLEKYKMNANIDIADGEVHVFSLVKPVGVESVEDMQYNLYMDGYENAHLIGEQNVRDIDLIGINGSKVTKRSDLELSKYLNEMVHPMLSILYMDIRAPGLTKATFFLSHEMVLRARPLFFAFVSGTLMQAKRHDTKYIFQQSSCLSPLTFEACSPTKNNHTKRCVFPFLENSQVKTAKEAMQKRQEAVIAKKAEVRADLNIEEDLNLLDLKKIKMKLFDLNRYEEIEQFIRFKYLKSLEKKLEKELEITPGSNWLDTAEFTSLIFAGQKHAGPSMGKLFAWPFIHSDNKFVIEEKLGPTPTLFILIAMSAGIVVVLLNIIVYAVGSIMNSLEKELIATTLFQDAEFKYDAKVLSGDLTTFDYTVPKFDYSGKGMMYTKKYFFTGFTCEHICYVAKCKSCRKLCTKKVNASDEIETYPILKQNKRAYPILKQNKRAYEGPKKKYFCFRSCFIRCWCCKYVNDVKATTVKDLVSPGSRVACTLNDLEEWREYKMEVLRKKKEEPKTFLEKTFKKVTADSGDEEIFKDGELINYIAMRNTSRRVMNNAALVYSYADMLYFIEAIFPSTATGSSAHISETLYNEIDHDSWLIEIGVLSTQILAPALFILPLAFALCYWTGLEGYYFWDLPITDSMDGFSKFYLDAGFLFALPAPLGQWTGLIRPSVIVIGFVSTIVIYLGVEMYNSLDMNVLHGTHYNKKAHFHRVLECRQILKHTGKRRLVLKPKPDGGFYNGLHNWKVDKRYISYPPPLNRKRTNWYNCCYYCKFRCLKRSPALRILFGLLELLMLWLTANRTFCCGLWKWRDSGFLERFYLKSDVEKELKMVKKEEKSKQKDPRMGKHTNKYRQVQLPGWTNWIIGKVGERDGNYYNVSFYDNEFLNDICFLIIKGARLGAETKERISKNFSPSIVNGQSFKTYPKNFEAIPGDVILYRHTRGHTAAEYGVGIILNVHDTRSKSESIEVCELWTSDTFCAGTTSSSIMCDMGSIWWEKKEEEDYDKENPNFDPNDPSISDIWKHLRKVRKNDFNAVESAPKFILKHINEAYEKSSNIITLENNAIGHDYTVVDARHFYPIPSQWERTETEPEFLKWQMGYRMFNYFHRAYLGYFSAFVTLLAMIWMILGLFIFPERFGPYATGIFVIFSNGRILIIKMRSHYAKIKSLIQEGLRREKMESFIPECLAFFDSYPGKGLHDLEEQYTAKVESFDRGKDATGFHKTLQILHYHKIANTIFSSATLVESNLSLPHLTSTLAKLKAGKEENLRFNATKRNEEFRNLRESHYHTPRDSKKTKKSSETRPQKKIGEDANTLRESVMTRYDGQIYDLNDKLIAMIEKYLNFDTCPIDEIIPPVALEKVLRRYNVSTKSIIIVVVISSFTLFALVGFLLIGMYTFTKQDGFSSGITSGLSLIAGFTINSGTMMQSIGSDADVEILVHKIITEYRKSTTHAGISLDDHLEDAL